MKPKNAPTAMGWTSRGRRWEWIQSWFLVFFLTFFLYWVPLVYMGVRSARIRWIMSGFFYALPFAGYLLVKSAASGTSDPEVLQVAERIATYLLRAQFGFLVAAAMHTWHVRGEFLVRISEDQHERDDLVAQARSRMESPNTEAQPERPAPPPRRLLNINTVGERELAMLPGLGPERAKQAIALREQQGLFGSFAEFADKLQITSETRAKLRAMFEEEARAPEISQNDPAYRVLVDGRRVLELNWASMETLAALPGLGVENARRAVTLRDGDGPFKSLEDFRFRLGLNMDAMIKLSQQLSVTSQSTRPGGGAKPAGRVVDV